MYLSHLLFSSLRGFRRATGNVWEKGRGLKQTTHAKWEGLKKEDMQERMLKPQVFTAYFEEVRERERGRKFFFFFPFLISPPFPSLTSAP